MGFWDWLTRKQKSPGPSGGIDNDYRVPITPLSSVSAGAVSEGGDYLRWMKHGGRDRYYEFRVPPGLPAGAKLPAVIILHGGGGYASVMRYQTGFDPIADREGFIAIYPAASAADYVDRFLFWNAGVPPRSQKQKWVDDVSFIEAVIQDVSPIVQLSRLYVCGLSNGSHMMFSLIARLPNTFAAAGGVAGQRAPGQYAPRPSRMTPLIYFHGTRDGYAPFMGGRIAYGNFDPFEALPVRSCMAQWAMFAGSTLPSTPDDVRGAALMHACGDNLEYWQVAGAGHTWPGGQKTLIEDGAGVGDVNRDISAAELMLKFFNRHRG